MEDTANGKVGAVSEDFLKVMGEADRDAEAVLTQAAERPHDSEEKIDFGGITASKKPRLALIPYEAIVALANRFELGEKKHAGSTWNALVNPDALKNQEWIKARIEHIVHHAYTYLAKMEGLMIDDGDDDAAAIMWGGTCLVMAQQHQTKRRKYRRRVSTKAPQS